MIYGALHQFDQIRWSGVFAMVVGATQDRPVVVGWPAKVLHWCNVCMWIVIVGLVSMCFHIG